MGETSAVFSVPEAAEAILMNAVAMTLCLDIDGKWMGDFDPGGQGFEMGNRQSKKRRRRNLREADSLIVGAG